MSYYPVIIVLVLAILDWVAAEKKLKLLEYIAKPATMLALLWWMWQSTGLGGEMLWFTIGVVFCLAGDVFLMLPFNMFIFGLLSFLIGHIAYIIGLNNAPPFINLMGMIMILLIRYPLAIAAAVILIIYLVWLYPKLAGGLKTGGKSGLRLPVLIYSLVISLMVYSAFITWHRPAWPHTAALSACIGAVLFYASDSMLAWDRFLKPLSHARLKVMTTYHLGQIGIILGAMLMVLSN